MDVWNVQLIAISIAVSVVALLALHRAPHLLRLVPGWIAVVATTVAVFERILPIWASAGVLALWLVRDRARLEIQLALVAIGSIVLALDIAGAGTLLPWVVVLAIPPLGWAVGRAAATADAELALVLLLLTALGQWAATPDTEATAILATVIGVFTIDALVNGGTIRHDTWWPLVGLMVWACAWGSIGRPSAMAGCLAAFGVLLADPVRRWIAPRPTQDPAVADDPDERRRIERQTWIPSATLLLAIHIPSVLVASRVAGVADRPGVAVVVAGLVLIADVVALEIAWRRTTHPATRPVG